MAIQNCLSSFVFNNSSIAYLHVGQGLNSFPLYSSVRVFFVFPWSSCTFLLLSTPSPSLFVCFPQAAVNECFFFSPFTREGERKPRTVIQPEPLSPNFTRFLSLHVVLLHVSLLLHVARGKSAPQDAKVQMQTWDSFRFLNGLRRMSNGMLHRFSIVSYALLLHLEEFGQGSRTPSVTAL